MKTHPSRPEQESQQEKQGVGEQNIEEWAKIVQRIKSCKPFDVAEMRGIRQAIEFLIPTPAAPEGDEAIDVMCRDLPCLGRFLRNFQPKDEATAKDFRIQLHQAMIESQVAGDRGRKEWPSEEERKAKWSELFDFSPQWQDARIEYDKWLKSRLNQGQKSTRKS